MATPAIGVRVATFARRGAATGGVSSFGGVAVRRGATRTHSPSASVEMSASGGSGAPPRRDIVTSPDGAGLPFEALQEQLCKLPGS